MFPRYEYFQFHHRYLLFSDEYEYLDNFEEKEIIGVKTAKELRILLNRSMVTAKYKATIESNIEKRIN